MKIRVRAVAGILMFLGALLLIAGPVVSADASAILAPGKSRTGQLMNAKVSKQMPNTQDVTVRVEKIGGNTAEVYVAWSKTSKGTGDAGSGTFSAEMIRGGEVIELSGQTGEHSWHFTFNPDGTVKCFLNIPSRGVSRWGDLHP